MSIESLCDKTVTLQQRSESRTQSGVAQYTWTDLTTTAKARIQPVTSYERTLALQQGHEISHVIYFAVDPGVGNGDRIVFGSRTFDVESKPIDFDEQGRVWKVTALETEQRQ